MATRIQLRRDTAAQWTANNPTLSTGEAGFVSDTSRLKIGDGATAWNSLGYIQVHLGDDTVGNYVATIAGTADQISVSGSGSETSAVTLSLPQNIATTSSPTFAGATLDAIKVGITATNEIDTASGNLILDSAGGTVEIDDNLSVSGNLTVNGTTTTVNSTTITVDDVVITLGGDSAPESDDNKDRGIEFRYFDSEARIGFMGYDDSSGNFVFLTDATNTNEVFSGTRATIDANISSASISLSQADTATAASHYFVETGSDGIIRPKTLANVQSEIVTTSAVNSAAATTLGTVATGTWEASDIGLAYGGTGATLTAVNGGVVYSTGSAMAITAAGTSGQVLTSTGDGAPIWQSASSGGLDPFLLGGM